LDQFSQGRPGDNIITGGAGDDTLAGGAGADQLIGGGGIDTADYASSGSAVTVDLSTGSGGDAAGDSYSGIENVIGSAYDDTLSSTSSGHSLAGGDGNDIITIEDGSAYGDDGDDVISSDGTAGTLYGGDGADTLIFDYSGDAYGGEGSDVYDLDASTLSAVTLQDTGSSGFDVVYLPFADALSFTQTQVGNDLFLSDGSHSVQLTNWFAGYDSIEQFQTLDSDTFSL
jgi:Ca2+-binding RTX toxin-like protein